MMDEKKLEELYQMVRENNSMLRSARRSAFIGGIFKVVWWVVILVVIPYITWLYLEPYLGAITDQYSAIQGKGTELSQQAQGLQNQLSGFQELLNQFTGGGQ